MLPKSIRFLFLLSIFAIIGSIFYIDSATFSHNFAQNSIQTQSETSSKLYLSGEVNKLEIKSGTEIKTEIKNEPLDPRLEKLLMSEENFVNENTQFSSIDSLIQAFNQTQDTNLINPIVEELVSTYQFIPAKKFIQSLTNEQKYFIDPNLDILVTFNTFQLSSSSAISNLQTKIENYKSSQSITADEANRYCGIIALMQQNYQYFFDISRSFKNQRYQEFSAKIASIQTKVNQPGDMPSYYLDALISIELFNQGLFYPAKVLALNAVSQNTKYILPYQVLAYSNFFSNSRDAAIEYFTTLKSLDPESNDKYTFFIGIAHYRAENYTNSVLYLSQIKSTSIYYPDIQRYLILDYLSLEQYSKANEVFDNLLQSGKINASDFYSYFSEVFFKPYAKGGELNIYKANPSLAKQYISSCETFLASDQTLSSVCAYGKAGLSLLQQTNIDLEAVLLELIKDYPQGVLFQALGEYYQRHNDPTNAKYYLLKAISLADSEQERYQIKSLLQKVVE
ncbi:hypothetical protein AGMMS50249_3140 [candidate division SR1 bacterium]|nr:hypothetical protein AGMMS50249_3140 [candidate division SR1 bacterium]